jgi:hypothetical protein
MVVSEVERVGHPLRGQLCIVGGLIDQSLELWLEAMGLDNVVRQLLCVKTVGPDINLCGAAWI